MDFKKEFTEYRNIYNTYFDSLEQESKKAAQKTTEIIQKDKEDIQMQLDSKEKQEMLQEYMYLLMSIQLISVDMYKISQRLLYINEAAIRKSIDLELSEEDKKFIQGLSLENKLTYVIDSNGNLTPKMAGLEDIIRKRVAGQKDKTYLYLEQIRKSPEYVGE